MKNIVLIKYLIITVFWGITTLGIAQPSIPMVLSAQGRHNTFVGLLKASGYWDTFEAKREFTILAPNDDEFLALPQGFVASLYKPANKQKLYNLVKAHIIPEIVDVNKLRTLSEIRTISDYRLTVEHPGRDVLINGKKITHGDIRARNGIIHSISGIILINVDTTTTK